MPSRPTRYNIAQRLSQLLCFVIGAAGCGFIANQGIPLAGPPNYDLLPSYNLLLAIAIPLSFAGFVLSACQSNFCFPLDHQEDYRRWRNYNLIQTGCFLVNDAAIGTFGYLYGSGYAWLLCIPSIIATSNFVALTFKDAPCLTARVDIEQPTIALSIPPTPMLVTFPASSLTTPLLHPTHPSSSPKTNNLTNP